MRLKEYKALNQKDLLKSLNLFKIKLDKPSESKKRYRGNINKLLIKKLLFFSIISSIQMNAMDGTMVFAASEHVDSRQNTKISISQKDNNIVKAIENYINVELVPAKIRVNGKLYDYDGFTIKGSTFISPEEFDAFINNIKNPKQAVDEKRNVVIDKAQLEMGEIDIDDKKYIALKSIAEQLGYETFWDKDNKEVIAAKKDYLLGLIKQVWIDAVLNKDTKIYKSSSLKEEIGTLKKGTKVVLVQDRDCKKANIKCGNINGWVKYSDINVSKTNYIKNKKLPTYLKEYFINTKQYKSDTDKLIWVNLENTTVNVFQKSENGWKLIKEYPCSIGKNGTPTINGEFKYERIVEKERHEGFYVTNVMKFYGAFGLHSVLMKNESTYYDGRVKQAISNGCLRLLPKDIQWVDDNCKFGTTVVVW